MHKRTPRIRWAAALAAVAIATIAAPIVAEAATGGAASYGGVGNDSGASSESGEKTHRGIAFTGWKSAGASWYGPGLYGRTTACGRTLRPRTIGVAHKNLPCGTLVKFRHRGHVVFARVIDRGPYIQGRAWDLTQAASRRLDFEAVGVGPVRYAVPKRFGRKFRRGLIGR